MQVSRKRWKSFSLILLQISACHSVFSRESQEIIDNKKNAIVKNSLENKELSENHFSHSFGLALEHAHYHYIEPDVFQDFLNAEDERLGARWAQWKGNTWGGSAYYRLTWNHSLFLQPEVRLLYGRHQYNWGRQERIMSKTNHSIPSLIFEPRLTLGRNFLVNKDFIISPYSGIGYRFKSDDGDDAMCDDGEKLGFYRKSNYVYVPLGASAEYRLDNAWSISLKGEYDRIIKAWQYTKRSPNADPSGKGYSINYKQSNGYGLKGEFSMGYLYKKVKFSLSPYINYWNIRNSKEKDGGAMEPYNITWETGLKLGVSF